MYSIICAAFFQSDYSGIVIVYIMWDVPEWDLDLDQVQNISSYADAKANEHVRLFAALLSRESRKSFTARVVDLWCGLCSSTGL